MEEMYVQGTKDAVPVFSYNKTSTEDNGQSLKNVF